MEGIKVSGSMWSRANAGNFSRFGNSEIKEKMNKVRIKDSYRHRRYKKTQKNSSQKVVIASNKRNFNDFIRKCGDNISPLAPGRERTSASASITMVFFSLLLHLRRPSDPFHTCDSLDFVVAAVTAEREAQEASGGGGGEVVTEVEGGKTC